MMLSWVRVLLRPAVMPKWISLAVVPVRVVRPRVSVGHRIGQPRGLPLR